MTFNTYLLGTPFYEKKNFENIYPVAMATKVSMGIENIFLRKKHVNRYILTSNGWISFVLLYLAE